MFCGNLQEQTGENDFPRIPTGILFCSYRDIRKSPETSGILREKVIKGILYSSSLLRGPGGGGRRGGSGARRRGGPPPVSLYVLSVICYMLSLISYLLCVGVTCYVLCVMCNYVYVYVYVFVYVSM